MVAEKRVKKCKAVSSTHFNIMENEFSMKLDKLIQYVFRLLHENSEMREELYQKKEQIKEWEQKYALLEQQFILKDMEEVLLLQL